MTTIFEILDDYSRENQMKAVKNRKIALVDVDCDNHCIYVMGDPIAILNEFDDDIAPMTEEYESLEDYFIEKGMKEI